jgi:hypothetical protein
MLFGQLEEGADLLSHEGDKVDNCPSSLQKKIAHQGKKGNASGYCRGYVLPSLGNPCKIFWWFRGRYVLQSLGNSCR